jgi:hypothetical protein
MGNTKSFAMQLRKILSVRRDTNIQSGELIDVPVTNQPGLMILVHRLKESGMTQITAINFSRNPAQQALDMPQFRQTTAIDLMTGLAEKKPLESSTIRIAIPPLSGKVILFQTKYFD